MVQRPWRDMKMIIGQSPTRKSKRVGVVQPVLEAPEKPYCSLPVLKERWRIVQYSLSS